MFYDSIYWGTTNAMSEMTIKPTSTSNGCFITHDQFGIRREERGVFLMCVAIVGCGIEGFEPVSDTGFHVVCPFLSFVVTPPYFYCFMCATLLQAKQKST
jgi:hypothetical protein